MPAIFAHPGAMDGPPRLTDKDSLDLRNFLEDNEADPFYPVDNFFSAYLNTLDAEADPRALPTLQHPKATRHPVFD